MPSYDTVKEKVPPYRKKPGELSFAGSNNSLIVLGSDVAHGDDSGAGSACVVAGRSTERLDLSDDKSYMYLSMKGDPDSFAGTEDTGSDRSKPTAIVKSDHVRIVSREVLKIKVGSASIVMRSDGTIMLDGTIKLGSGAIERALKGDSFVREYMLHTHVSTAPGNPTSPPSVPLTPAVYSRKNFIE